MHRHLFSPVLLVLAAALALLLAACAEDDKVPTPTSTPDVGPSSAPVPSGFAEPGILVDTSWLARNLDEPGVTVLDVRSASD